MKKREINSLLDLVYSVELFTEGRLGIKDKKNCSIELLEKEFDGAKLSNRELLKMLVDKATNFTIIQTANKQKMKVSKEEFCYLTNIKLDKKKVVKHIELDGKIITKDSKLYDVFREDVAVRFWLFKYNNSVSKELVYIKDIVKLIQDSNYKVTSICYNKKYHGKICYSCIFQVDRTGVITYDRIMRYVEPFLPPNPNKEL